MVGELWRNLARKYIVGDVPDEMAACFDCNALQCNDDKYETCPNRLAQTGAPRIARTGERSISDLITAGR